MTSDRERVLREALGSNGDLSTALAEALHAARTLPPGNHEVVTAITGAFDALRELRALAAASPEPDYPEDRDGTDVLREQNSVSDGMALFTRQVHGAAASPEPPKGTTLIPHRVCEQCSKPQGMDRDFYCAGHGIPPEAASPNNQVACVACKQPVEVTALNAIRCVSCQHEIDNEPDDAQAMAAHERFAEAVASPAPEECGHCDGCGWYEGGKTLKTTCEKCGGTGVAGGTNG